MVETDVICTALFAHFEAVIAAQGQEIAALRAQNAEYAQRITELGALAAAQTVLTKAYDASLWSAAGASFGS